MTEAVPLFFPNRERRRLFGVLHRAEQQARRFAVVYCAPLFEEKLWSHRVLANFARFLAAQGVPVLRFDYYGDGESEGLFEEATVHSRVGDILDAAQFCRDEVQVDKICLLGLGYGGTMAIEAAPRADYIAGVAAWSPIVDSRQYIYDTLRQNLAAQIVVHRKVINDRDALVAQINAGQDVNVEGYEIGRALYAEMIAVDLIQQLQCIDKPVLALQVAPGERIDPQYAPLQQLSNELVRFEAIREDKFWLQQKKIFPECRALFTRTAAWLNQITDC
jgi:uncharacterized protein